MNVINVQKLCKTFTTNSVTNKVLKNIDLEVKKGEFLTIMGPSGSGKSTLLNILGLLDVQNSGVYKLDSVDIQNLSDEKLAHLRNQKFGFIFQSFNLLDKESVYNNVILPLHYSNTEKEKWHKRVLECIEMVGLSHRINSNCNTLSGGERQRVAIARALVNKPSVILADEPTGNLDSKSGQAIMQILQDLNQKLGHTIILITHEQYTALHADRIIKIKDGSIESDKKNKNKVKASNFNK